MATAPIIHLRTPAVVLCDLTTVGARVHCLLAMRDPTPADDAERTRLEQRHAALEQEFRAVIYAHTGVSADLICEALA
jgi:hypothetical protein